MEIDIELVRRMTEQRSFQRGRDYARSGAVGCVQHLVGGARATVQGSDDYAVELRSDPEGGLSHRCSCPVGATFCKHCVALAIVVSESGRPEPPGPRGYLESLGRGELVEIILEVAQRDEVLQTKLAVASAAPESAHDLRRAIEDAVVPGGYVPYREAHGYASSIDIVLERLDGLLSAGYPDLVIDLTEHALTCAERAVELVDDSDGLLSGVADRLGELHLAACEAARPDPVQLASRLYERELAGGNLEAFYGAMLRYADVLGEPGLAVYLDLAERDWSALPTLTPEEPGTYDGRRFQLTHIMLSLAELTRDADAETEILSRDLSSAYQFVRIAERYLRDGRHDDALRWAERGIREFGSSDARLVEVAAEEYHHAGRGPAAVQLLWDTLDTSPTLGNYQRLAEHAGRDCSWSRWRGWALDRMRDQIARREPPKYRWQPPADATLLVEIFLWEDDPDRAWAEAQRGGCSGSVSMRLARACQDARPLEVIPLYQQRIESLIDAKNNHVYAEAVELLGQVEVLFSNAGQATRFSDYVAGVRRRHKPKRNLMKLFDSRGW
jgi:tetratricopeptide (TPR) repeat protein